MDDIKYWNKFKDTGKISDYINYVNIKNIASGDVSKNEFYSKRDSYKRSDIEGDRQDSSYFD